MSILMDSILAFFSCVGIWTLWKMLIGYHFTGGPRAVYRLSKEDSITWTKPENTIK